MAGGPLEGVRIVDLTSVVVGPLATQILADHGAEVIKVETKTGDLIRNMNGKSVTPGMGAKFLHLNRNKRSLVLDLASESGRIALTALVDKADVVLFEEPASVASALRAGRNGTDSITSFPDSILERSSRSSSMETRRRLESYTVRSDASDSGSRASLISTCTRP